MKITNIKLYVSVEALARLMAQPLPVAMSFKLKKLKKTLLPIIETIEEGIKEVNNQYILKDDAGNARVVTDQAGKVIPGAYLISKEGVDERNKLDAVENEIEVDVIKISDLPAATTISENDLEALDWLLVE
jgi:hypothetical protein